MFEYRGVKFPANADIFSDNISNAIAHGYYESDESQQIISIVHQNERVLEIGAGIGLISTLAAKNPMVEKVVAYEADPRLCDYMRTVHQINGVSVSVNNRIIANSPEPLLDFYVREDFWESSLLVDPGFRTKIRVRTQAFQETIDREDPTLIVVDIEGGEVDLFDNIRFNSVRRILLEIHQDLIGREGVKHIFHILGASGFHYDQWHSRHGVICFSHIERVNAPIASRN